MSQNKESNDNVSSNNIQYINTDPSQNRMSLDYSNLPPHLEFKLPISSKELAITEHSSAPPEVHEYSRRKGKPNPKIEDEEEFEKFNSWFMKSELFQTIYKNDFETFKKELQDVDTKIPSDIKIPVKAVNNIAQYATMIALGLGRVDIAKYLLSLESVDISFVTFIGLTLTDFAAISGNMELTQLLLQQGGTINIKPTPYSILCPLMNAKTSEKEIKEMVNFLLEKGLDIDEKDPRERTPLMIAAEEGKTGLVNFLLDKGANIEAQDEGGETALIIAINESKVEATKLLLERGANPNIKDYNGRPALIKTLNENYTTYMLQLLENSPPDVPNPYVIGASAIPRSYKEEIASFLEREIYSLEVRSNGDTPLLIAIRKSNKEEVALLLEKNATIEIDKYTIITALKIAIETNQLEIAKLLLQYKTHQIETNQLEILKLLLQDKVDLNVKDQNGDTLLMKAIRYDKVEAVKLLLNHNVNLLEKDYNGDIPIFTALRNKKATIVSILLDKHIDTEAENRDGNNLLMMGLIYDNVEVVEWSLAKGLKVNENYGSTPFFIACKNNNIKLIEFFLSKGEDIEARDPEGNTPLLIALSAHNINLEVIELLLNKGAKIDEKDNQGNTPLLKALSVHNINLKLIKFLLDNGAKIDERDNEGTTPLLKAVFHNANIEVIKLLLEKGAKIDEKDNHGDTPLLKALYSYNIKLEIIDLLLDRGAKIDEKDNQGNTPLLKALSAYIIKPDIIELLLNRGAKTDIKNNNGETPLLIAVSAYNPNIEIIEKILKFSHIEEKDNQGNAPLLKALNKYNANIEVIKFLLDHGANIEATNNFQDKPLKVSLQKGNPKITKLLLSYIEPQNYDRKVLCDIIINSYNEDLTKIKIVYFLNQRFIKSPQERWDVFKEQFKLNSFEDVVKCYIDHLDVFCLADIMHVEVPEILKTCVPEIDKVQSYNFKLECIKKYKDVLISNINKYIDENPSFKKFFEQMNSEEALGNDSTVTSDLFLNIMFIKNVLGVEIFERLKIEFPDHGLLEHYECKENDATNISETTTNMIKPTDGGDLTCAGNITDNLDQ